MKRLTNTEAAAAYVLDRAAQYVSGSGIVTALENVARALANNEHLVARDHGELDDLTQQVRRLRRPDSGG